MIVAGFGASKRQSALQGAPGGPPQQAPVLQEASPPEAQEAPQAVPPLIAMNQSVPAAEPERSAPPAEAGATGGVQEYISADEAKRELVAGEDGMPPLRLVSSVNGLDLALPDGRLVDYRTLALRHFTIFGFRVTGGKDPQVTFRTGQQVRVQREQDNPQDPQAVAVMVGRPAVTIGYVNKQRAKWASALLDNGSKLQGVVIQAKSSPSVLLATPEVLAHLRRPADGAGQTPG